MRTHSNTIVIVFEDRISPEQQKSHVDQLKRILNLTLEHDFGFGNCYALNAGDMIETTKALMKELGISTEADETEHALEERALATSFSMVEGLKEQLGIKKVELVKLERIRGRFSESITQESVEN